MSLSCDLDELWCWNRNIIVLLINKEHFCTVWPPITVFNIIINVMLHMFVCFLSKNKKMNFNMKKTNGGGRGGGVVGWRGWLEVLNQLSWKKTCLGANYCCVTSDKNGFHPTGHISGLTLIRIPSNTIICVSEVSSGVFFLIRDISKVQPAHFIIVKPPDQVPSACQHEIVMCLSLAVCQRE